MSPTFFANPTEFRNWLEKNHKTETELIVGFYKVKSGKPSITWSQSVDQALCFGWIDGVRNSIDKESYCIRFTPRRKTSFWSAINIKKMEELTKAGLMTEAGRKAFSFRTEDKSYGYSHGNEYSELSKEFERLFKKEKAAWEFFNNQAPSYLRLTKHWIMSAKQEKTRLSRLNKTIEASRNQKRVS
tara:strand:- start:341 stop:898 length:558 start_codon:yes stop_codon:yes gene_type:complete